MNVWLAGLLVTVAWFILLDEPSGVIPRRPDFAGQVALKGSLPGHPATPGYRCRARTQGRSAATRRRPGLSALPAVRPFFVSIPRPVAIV